MLRWNSVAPDIRVSKLGDSIGEWNLVDSIKVVSCYLTGRQIFMKKECLESITEQLSSDMHELGGILLGEVFECDMASTTGYNYITFITEAVRCDICENSAVSLKMGLDVWSKAGPLITRDHIVVGWYHSHPNLGAFFSGTDRETQRHFFKNDYSIGLVVDPYRQEQKCFVGQDAKQFRGTIEILSENPRNVLI
ncbi:MAG TPA: Mov34/MPN/PAD-1 family protein [Candidatus Omnitrophota bacterium]|nr:Mov34/MPN/PAD-1 family protein [Candidatus Omnitrophota bacterium]